jgi:hypothetical protein
MMDEMKRRNAMTRLFSVACLTVCVAFCVGQDAQPGKSPSRLIDDLDDPRFKIREEAYRELERLGDAAVPALLQALKKPTSVEQRDRLFILLAKRRPSEFDADFNGWNWIYNGIAHLQTFEATGATIKSLRLRVAQLNANRPAGPLDVEVRDPKLEYIYARGTIDPTVTERDFRWQPVTLKQVAPLKFGDPYAIVFHSRLSRNFGPWVVNAVYRDVYPHGNLWHAKNQDFFFHIEYHEGTSIRVGPKGDDVKLKTPINSGNGGGTPGDGPLAIQDFGVLPTGKLKGMSESKE